MKLVWSPEAALKANIDTVKAVSSEESSAVELLSAMAAGWNARLVVETWSRGGATATSTGLSVATNQTGGRHVCIVPDEELRLGYKAAMGKSCQLPEVMVGQPEAIMEGLDGIDFLVVDCRSNNFTKLLSAAKLSHHGAVWICKNASSKGASGFRWRSVLDGRYRIVRSVFLLVAKGLDIAYVGGGGSEVSGKRQSNWVKVKHVDRRSGEEFVIRK